VAAVAEDLAGRLLRGALPTGEDWFLKGQRAGRTRKSGAQRLSRAITCSFSDPAGLSVARKTTEVTGRFRWSCT